MGTIQSYRKFIEEYKLKIYQSVTKEILPVLKEILDSYNDKFGEYDVYLCDSDLNVILEDSTDYMICVKLHIPNPMNNPDFDLIYYRIYDIIRDRIESEFDDLDLYREEELDNKLYLVYKIK